jgi:hypothetical protein
MKNFLKKLNRPGVSNLIALIASIASLIAVFITLITILPKHHLSYFIKTEFFTETKEEKGRIGEFINSSSYMLFLNKGNTTKSVIDVTFYLVQRDSKKIVQKSNWFDAPFILQGGQTTEFMLRQEIISLSNLENSKVDITKLFKNPQNYDLKILVTYIGKLGSPKTHQYIKNLKDIIKDSSYTNKEIIIE